MHRKCLSETDSSHTGNKTSGLGDSLASLSLSQATWFQYTDTDTEMLHVKAGEFLSLKERYILSANFSKTHV